VQLIALDEPTGPEPMSMASFGAEIADLGVDFTAGPDGFLDLAAVMMNLDLIVTGGGVIAHLAGALGRPLWVLLKDVPDWRWLLDRTDSPWYPTALLFRQRRRDDWEGLVAQAAGALAPLVAQTTGQSAAAAPGGATAEAMAAYVINLARRPDRRERFFRWNAGKGLDISLMEAVDGASLSKTELYQASLIDDENLPYSPGALGIALSHRRLWEICLDSQQSMMIFEDDAFIPASMSCWRAKIAEEMHSGCDFLYVGYNRDAILSLGFAGAEWCNLSFANAGMPFDEQAQRYERWSSASSHCVLETRLAWGILAYAITPRAADLLLRHCFPLSTKFLVNMYGSGRVLTAYGIDCIMNTLIQRGIIKARAIFPPLVIGPNDQHDSDGGHSG
jgi:GR25 family glycosyltransferase involved in LPS biosynthesis